jgi:hypothetical protein
MGNAREAVEVASTPGYTFARNELGITNFDTSFDKGISSAR